MVWCDDCDGEGIRFRPRLGGNDPDGVWVRCETCEGRGKVLVADPPPDEDEDDS